MKDLLKWVLGIMLLLTVISVFDWVIDNGIATIKDKGLKNIISEIWEGESN